MAANTFGQVFRVTTFGESHGAAIGCIIDGCPAGLHFDLPFIQSELDRRRPGQSAIVTQRKESDIVQVLSGVFNDKTTGTPIALVINNEDQHSKDYDHIASTFRPSHADITWEIKFGNRDYRGGGRSSARETAARVAAGAIAKLMLRELGITVQAYVNQVGHIALEKPYSLLDLSLIESNEIRCPDPETAQKMIEFIKKVKKEGDTVGGIITGLILGCPPGVGEPVFDKLQADLAKAMMSINAAKGFEYGSGFEGVSLRGSQHNDEILPGDPSNPKFKTNQAGGILGGISNGDDIYFRVGFKPIATIMRDQLSIDKFGDQAVVKGKGRHDPCVLPRAVPIVEAMTALVLVDHLLISKINTLGKPN